MKKRITIGTLTLLSLMGMFGCKQQETVEALMTLDVNPLEAQSGTLNVGNGRGTYDS